jgi:hypothetical protein
VTFYCYSDADARRYYYLFVGIMQVDSEDSKNRTNDDRRILQVTSVTRHAENRLNINLLKFAEAMLQLPACCAKHALSIAHLLFYAYKRTC